jgi:hypothetical protein
MPSLDTPTYASLYRRLIDGGDPQLVIKDLISKLPEYSVALTALQVHTQEVYRQNQLRTITSEAFTVARNRIVTAIVAFLDALHKGNPDLASSHLAIGDEAHSALDEVIESQLEFNAHSVKENKMFRRAVGLLFLVAVVFSALVTINHLDFLQEELDVIGLLAVSILLYVCIGVLALYALTLIIRGSLYNQYFLNFSRKTLKR